ncbi:acyl carrier protein [Sorangium sp. So ce134]
MVTTEDILRIIETTDLPASASALRADAPLVAQGLDSFDVATLILAVESKYQKAIPPERVAQLRTLQDIVDYLNA